MEYTSQVTPEFESDKLVNLKIYGLLIAGASAMIALTFLAMAWV